MISLNEISGKFLSPFSWRIIAKLKELQQITCKCEKSEISLQQIREKALPLLSVTMVVSLLRRATDIAHISVGIFLYPFENRRLFYLRYDFCSSG